MKLLPLSWASLAFSQTWSDRFGDKGVVRQPSQRPDHHHT
jgi:hypothetical protein